MSYCCSVLVPRGAGGGINLWLVTPAIGVPACAEVLLQDLQTLPLDELQRRVLMSGLGLPVGEEAQGMPISNTPHMVRRGLGHFREA